mgnify:CR=1 FL=1
MTAPTNTPLNKKSKIPWSIVYFVGGILYTTFRHLAVHGWGLAYPGMDLCPLCADGLLLCLGSLETRETRRCRLTMRCSESGYRTCGCNPCSSWARSLSSNVSRMLKSPPAAFSLRSEAQRTEAYASLLRSLRPCWTAFLSILCDVLLLP